MSNLHDISAQLFIKQYNKGKLLFSLKIIDYPPVISFLHISRHYR